MPTAPKPNTKIKTKSSRQKVIARIHIGKAQLCLDDDTYRMVLEFVTGKTSCREMTLAELFAVEHHMIAKGFRPLKGGSRRMSPQSRHKPRYEKTSVDKLRALWIDMAKKGEIADGSENALEAWVIRMSKRYNQGRGIEKIDWLNQNHALCSHLIECLKKWQQRLE